MLQETVCGVTGVLLDEVELLDDIVIGGGVCGLEEAGVLGIEWSLHVESVEPHLVRISGAVPETTWRIVSFARAQLGFFGIYLPSLLRVWVWS